MIGVIRLILEIVHPVPRCGEPDTRPAILSNVHGFYFSQLMMLIELILVVGISLLTKQNTEEQVNMGLVARKPIFRVFNIASFKPVCSATKTS